MKYILMLGAVSIFLLTPCFSQAPAVSHDGQKFPVSVDECARLGRRTLEREGYQIGATGNNWVSGAREIHRALIICDTAADGTWTNVIVSSNTPEYSVSGNEQRLLMNRMVDVMANRRFEDRDRDRDGDRDRDRDRDRRPGWLSVTNQQPLPGNSVPGGKEPNHPVPQYVCRAQHEGNLVPGKTVTIGSTDCFIVSGEVEVRKIAFDVLTGDADDYVWTVPNPDRRSLYTGSEGGVNLRSCRFELYVHNENKGLQVGKEVFRKCVVGYKGIAYSSDRYEVLYAR
jgi:Protein of unknown function (DUF3421)